MAKKIYGYFLVDQNKYGITDSWEECKKIIENKNVRYKGFYTEDECKNWLNDGAKYVSKEKNTKKVKKNDVILPDGIYFDAGTGRGLGVEVRVTDKKGHSLITKDHYSFKKNEFDNIALGKERTNNFGELLGLSMAITFAMENNTKNIYGDSNLVIKYWSTGAFHKDELPEDTVKLINYVINQRKKYEEAGGKVTHISGDINPADIGFHK